MKSIEDSQLWQEIFEFLCVLDDCIKNTEYSEDRARYAYDIAKVAEWIVRLYRKEPESSVAADIVNSKTAKFMTDYWKKGRWGEVQSHALAKLQDKIRKQYQI